MEDKKKKGKGFFESRYPYELDMQVTPGKIKEIKQSYDELGKEGLKIVAVTDEPVDMVRRFLERNPYPFTILVDQKGTLAARLGVWSVPSTLVLDSYDKLVHFHLGARLWNTIDVLNSLQMLAKE